MCVVIAMMKHETNTFSPLPTPLANFACGLMRCTMSAQWSDAEDAGRLGGGPCGE